MEKRLLSKFGAFLPALIVAVMLFPPAEAGAQPDPQSRLMAKRAAKVDALRNLAEIVYGVRISSSTTVGIS